MTPRELDAYLVARRREVESELASILAPMLSRSSSTADPP